MNLGENGRLDEPRIVEGRALLIAGIVRTHSRSNAGMAAQWGEFAPWLGRVPGQQGATAYGVLFHDTEAGIDYLTGVEVSDFEQVPAELSRLRIAPRRYAVFRHAGHVSTVSASWMAIWSDWFPRSGFQAVDAPMFERYPDTFDPATGNGGFEIWIPIEPKA